MKKVRSVPGGLVAKVFIALHAAAVSATLFEKTPIENDLLFYLLVCPVWIIIPMFLVGVTNSIETKAGVLCSDLSLSILFVVVFKAGLLAYAVHCGQLIIPWALSICATLWLYYCTNKEATVQTINKHAASIEDDYIPSRVDTLHPGAKGMAIIAEKIKIEAMWHIPQKIDKPLEELKEELKCHPKELDIRYGDNISLRTLAHINYIWGPEAAIKALDIIKTTILENQQEDSQET